MLNFRLLFALFIIGVSTSLAAQYTISGRVINANGEPLIQASVFVVESQYATITDDDGYYRLTDLEAGEHTLKASFVGYQSFVNYIELASDITVDINLGDNKLYLQAISISTNRVADNGVFAKTDIDKETLEKDNLAQDMPYLLRWTPSAVVTSDAGTGIGYTGLRIRGTDATRINVTINGVPVNDAESQAVFWVNMPDLASSVDNVQIQRGVGTSTNGPGAFGGTVSLQTDAVHQNNYIHANGTVGSFGTRRGSVAIGTGLINNRFTIDGRYSSVKSDGFIDRGSADLSSYYLALGRVTDRSSLKFITFSGAERTYQAWNGVPQAKAEGDEQGALDHFLRNQSFLYPTPQDSANYFENGRDFNQYLYENQVDDYSQTHYQLHHLLSASDKLTFKTTAFFTAGAGFFEQYRYQDDLAFYGVPETNEQGETILTADTLIRRKWLDNDLFGAIFTAKYQLPEGSIQLGGAASRYDGDHFGRVIYVQGFSVGRINESGRYYENKGIKDDYHAYLKYDQTIGKVGIFADAQVRRVNYGIVGILDDLAEVNVDRDWTFFNPKFGVTYNPNEKQNIYASIAIANREPDRNDVLNVTDTPAKAERLTDLEVGYRYNTSKWRLEWNNYFMSYDDQLVLTGALDDVGNARRINVNNSYRLGAELSATGEIYKNVFWNINTTLSRNRIAAFQEVIDPIVIEHENTDIAYSPNLIIGNAFMYRPTDELEIELATKYVGKQYLDNTSNEDRKLDPYSYTNLRVAYDWDTSFIDGIRLTLQVNNLFDAKYSANGYTFSYDVGAAEPITENYVYPQAGVHFMLGAQVRL